MWLGLALVAVLLRAVVPAGFMLSSPSTPGFIEICGAGLMHDEAVALHVAGSDNRGEAPGKPARDAEACPFSVLSMAAVAAAGPALLAGSIAYILDLGVASTQTPALPPVADRRPPVRGPPARA